MEYDSVIKRKGHLGRSLSQKRTSIYFQTHEAAKQANDLVVTEIDWKLPGWGGCGCLAATRHKGTF